MTASPLDTPRAALVDGIDIDAVAAIVRGCAGVSALDGGPFGEVASYLPGRTVPGVAVDESRIRVQIRSKWGVPATDVAALITAALAPLAGPRPVDVAIADIDDPPGGSARRSGRRDRLGTARSGAAAGLRAAAPSVPPPGCET
ncbi:MAG: hypothetical protein QOG28_1509 [Trebonia sp.]|jgi:hypothetical protein|nr:hypothetical protein [Trebonia sp.]